MFDQVANVFFDEANELLDNLEGYLLTLESKPGSYLSRFPCNAHN